MHAIFLDFKYRLWLLIDNLDRVHEEVDLQVKLELHRLGFLVSHRDGHVLVEPRHEVLAVALLERLHYEQHTSTSSCRKD